MFILRSGRWLFVGAAVRISMRSNHMGVVCRTMPWVKSRGGEKAEKRKNDKFFMMRKEWTLFFLLELWKLKSNPSSHVLGLLGPRFLFSAQAWRCCLGFLWSLLKCLGEAWSLWLHLDENPQWWTNVFFARIAICQIWGRKSGPRIRPYNTTSNVFLPPSGLLIFLSKVQDPSPHLASPPVVEQFPCSIN